MERCRAVFEALVESGVDPSRVSFRPMGEVQPTKAGTTESDLAANRRVEFRIVELLQPLDQKPPYATETILPWTGEAHALKPTGDRIIGATEEGSTVKTSEDQQAEDLLKKYLREDREEDGATPPPQEAPVKDESTGDPTKAPEEGGK